MEPRRLGLNYLYFGFFLAVLCLTCTSSILLKDNLSGSRLFFWFYSIGQSLFEVSLLAFLCGVIDRFVGRIACWMFIGFTFILFILHLFDFMMDRVLDLSVWNTIRVFVLDESFENFYYLLEASGIPIWMWIVFFGFLLFLPFLGMLIYKATDWISGKKPLLVENEQYIQLFICVPAALFFWDYSASKVIHPDAYTEFVKSLPWKGTFIQPETIQIPMNTALRAPKAEGEIQQYISSVQTLEQKPNLFLFVAESLREDFLTEEAAPNLVQLKQQSVHGKVSLSNANATHISWFSIFHSEFPFYWEKTQTAGWNLGSPALALFKKLGYKIRVYSSAELQYYGMGHLLFGQDHHLADSMQLFPHPAPKEACESDAAALNALTKDLEDPNLKQGQFFIIFLDGTHFDYSWPKNEKPKFSPYATELAYFRAFHSKKNIEAIKNRYRNAVHHLDDLFGQCLATLPADAIVAFTGDHGEEFFDHGHLFHCSHLVGAQTKVPIYLKIPGQAGPRELISQMDIMPTLLDAVSGLKAPILEGESALKKREWPFVAIARFNASRTPYEFCLHNGSNQLLLQFENKKDIFDLNPLKILSLRNREDESLRERKDAIREWVHTEFDSALNRILPK